MPISTTVRIVPLLVLLSLAPLASACGGCQRGDGVEAITAVDDDLLKRFVAAHMVLQAMETRGKQAIERAEKAKRSDQADRVRQEIAKRSATVLEKSGLTEAQYRGIVKGLAENPELAARAKDETRRVREERRRVAGEKRREAMKKQAEIDEAAGRRRPGIQKSQRNPDAKVTRSKHVGRHSKIKPGGLKTSGQIRLGPKGAPPAKR